MQEGVSSVMQLFSAKGGQSLGNMLEALSGTELGKQLVAKLTGRVAEKSNDEPQTETGK